MGLGTVVAAVINALCIDFINNAVSKLTPISLELPSLTDDVGSYLVYSGLIFLVVVYRELLIGGRRPQLKLQDPPEAARDWVPATRLAPADQTIQDPADPTVIRMFDPTSGGVLGQGVAKVYSESDVKATVEAARVAQAEWVKTSFAERGEVLKLINDYIVRNQDLICRVASRDTGKTMVDGSFGEVLTTCEKITWTLSNGEAALSPESRGVGMLTIHKTAQVEYQPMGVLGAIIPWNYPFHNMLGQVISAIYSGNALVLKVSEHSCWSSEFYLRIVQEALQSRGHSPNVVQAVTGYGQTGAALIPAVDKLTFIGSPAVGKLVMRTAAETLTPVVLELGGKDAAIVCDDCDFDQVVDIAMRGTFQNCGQNCIGLERLVVHSNIYDKFVDAVAAKVKALSQGPPLSSTVDCGAMTMGANEIARIEKLVQQAVDSGARLLAGGKRNSTLPEGSFMEPTLLVDVTRDMDIARNEVFGPVMTVIRAKDDDDAVAIVNSTPYGLGGSVFSLDYARAGAIGRRLRTGMMNLNDFGVNYLCQSLPFGGINISGFDRFAGIEGIRGCCNPRAVTSDKVTGVRTAIPPPLQYPVGESGFQFVSGLISMFYGDGVAARIGGIVSLIIASTKGKPKQE